MAATLKLITKGIKIFAPLSTECEKRFGNNHVPFQLFGSWSCKYSVFRWRQNNFLTANYFTKPSLLQTLNLYQTRFLNSAPRRERLISCSFFLLRCCPLCFGNLKKNLILISILRWDNYGGAVLFFRGDQDALTNYPQPLRVLEAMVTSVHNNVLLGWVAFMLIISLKWHRPEQTLITFKEITFNITFKGPVCNRMYWHEMK